MAFLGIYRDDLQSPIIETSKDFITATAGGGQAGAVPILTQTSRISVVATSGDSVKLLPSQAGLEMLVINHGNNPMQVYGLGNDMINDVAASTGVSQIQNSSTIYICASAGNWYTEGLASGFFKGFQTQSATNAITATAAGTQATSFPLTSAINRITIVATIGDAVLLPQAYPGMQVTIINAAANSANIFPGTGDAVNALAANAAYALAGSKTAQFYSTVIGQWHTILSA